MSDSEFWSELTGLPVTDVEVIPGGQPVEGWTIDGQQVTYGDEYHLTIEGTGGYNGTYVVTAGE